MQIENAMHFSESMLFPVWVIDLYGEPMMQFINRHWHTELEFLTIIEGECTVTAGRNVYAMKEGNSLFIHSALLHQAVAGADGCRLQGFIFNKNLLISKRKMYVDEKFWEQIFSDAFGLTHYIKGKQQWERKIAEDIKEVYRLCRERPYAFELLVKSIIDNLFYQLIQHTEKEEKGIRTHQSSVNDLLWESICDYIHRNLQHSLSVSDISKALGLSQRSIYRCARQYGMTISEYINLCRIHKSCQMLQLSEKPITEIAIDLGFSDSSHFAAVFKRHMGCTPSEYKLIVSNNAT